MRSGAEGIKLDDPRGLISMIAEEGEAAVGEGLPPLILPGPNADKQQWRTGFKSVGGALPSD